MTQDDTGFRWTRRRLEAVRLVADDTASDEEIARQLGISRVTLARWKAHSAFQAELTRYVERCREQVTAKGIADKRNRLDEYNARWNALKEIRRQRSLAMAGVPGGSTGLMADRGNMGCTVDVGMLREMRELEKQAAIEMGEWNEKDRFDETRMLVMVIDGESDLPAGY